MKIVHVCLCCSIWYEKYGYQDQLLPQYHKMAGHDVTIITCPYSLEEESKRVVHDKSYERVLDNGAKLIRIKSLLPRTLNDHFYVFCGLRKALNLEKPDLIFVHGVESLNYLALVKYKKEHPVVHIVCDNHTDLINSFHHWATRFWSKFVTRNIVVRRLVPIVDWFYGVTPERSKFLIDYYRVPKEKVKLLVMGADDKQMHMENREEIRNRIRNENRIKEDDFLIVSGGRIVPYKVQTFYQFAKAIAEISEERVKFLFFGSVSDDAKKLIEDIQSSQIILKGWIPSERVYDYFYAADLVAFPGLHSVLWEQAVASQVPCAFNHIPGFEHVNFNNNCIWFEDTTTEYYKKVIQSLLPLGKKYHTLLMGAKDAKSSQFLYSGIAQQVIDDISDI